MTMPSGDPPPSVSRTPSEEGAAQSEPADGHLPIDGVFVHESAVVDEGAVLGVGTRVWHFVHVSAGAVIGRSVVLGQNVFVAPDVTVGDGCRIQNNVALYTGVHLAEEVFVGPSAVFTNVRTPRAHVSRKNEFAPTHVERRATIGANATIVCGVTLGTGSFVAAGAVVTRDVRPHVLVQGSPARPVGVVCDCGERLTDAADPTCGRCGAQWIGDLDTGLAPRETATP